MVDGHGNKQSAVVEQMTLEAEYVAVLFGHGVLSESQFSNLMMIICSMNTYWTPTMN